MPEYAGLIKYPTGSDIYGGGKEPQWWKDLATTTQAEIQASGGYRTHTSGTFNADDALDGVDLVHSAVTQTGTPAQGTWWITTATIVDTSRMQVAVSYGAAPRVMRRFRGSGGWSGWERTDAGAIDLTALGGGGSGASPASFKTVPLALTVGGGYTAMPDPTGGFRMPVRFGVTIKRWRLHLRNVNPRFGGDGDTLRLGHVYFGPATGGQYAATPNYLIQGYVDIAPGGVASAWQDTPLAAGQEYAIAYSVTGGTAEGSVGGGWSSDTAGGLNATLTRVSNLPLDAWIEAEVAPDVPVVAAFGDSISSGVGATIPVHDSWLSQWCRDHEALPVHYTASGDTMAGWSDSNAFKWQRWQHLSRPDAVIHAMGSNDVFGGASLSQMLERRATSLTQLASLVSPVIYSATILPRTAVTGAMEDTRRTYNAHILGLPDAARDVFDFIPAVSLDDEALSPGLTSDGTHLTTAGYAAVAGTITTPLTAPALSLAVDGLSERVTDLEAGSGLRDVTTLLGLTSGQAWLTVHRGWVDLTFQNGVATGSGNVTLTDTGLLSVAPEAPVGAKPGLVLEGSGTLRRIEVNRFGRVLIYGYGSGGVLNGSLSWPMTRPRPEEWPGNPV